MESLRRDSKTMQIGAHVIQRNQAVISIEGCVLQAFRHHRTGELLKFHGECGYRRFVSRILSFRDTRQKHFFDEIEHTSIRGRASSLGRRDSTVNVMRIVLRNSGWSDVRPIDGKVCHNLHQCIAQAV